MIETEFDYSPQALKAFFKFQLLMKEKTKWIFYATSTVFVIIGLLLVIIAKNELLGLLAIIIAIILVLSFPMLVNNAVNKHVKSCYKRDPQPIIFYDNKIIQKINGQIKEFSWLDVIEVNETRQYLYLYITKTSALIVDKDKLDQKVLRELIDLIKNHTGEIILYKYR